MVDDAPLFEVTTAAANAAARRLTTATKVQAVMFAGVATDTALIEVFIDRVSAAAVAHCRLASAATGTFPTFGRETCRATWSEGVCSARDSMIYLPWRTPVSSITSVVEDDDTLIAGTDYRLRAAGGIERLSGGVPVRWSSGEIVVVFVAGWDLATADTVPPAVEAAIIDQVRAMYLGRDRDPAVRSEAVPDVYQASYSVGGGETMGASGLLPQVEAALAPYRNWTAI